jgi:hypothetical protein
MPRFRLLILLAVAVPLCACAGEPLPSEPAIRDGEPLITIGDDTLGLSEIGYLLGGAVDEYTLFRDIESDMIDWQGQIEGLPVRRFFLDRVLEMAISAHVTSIKAAELGFYLSEEEEDIINWEIAMEVDYFPGGREAFFDYYGSEEAYRFYSYVIPVLREKMLQELFGQGGPYQPDDAALWRYYQNNYISAVFIFLTGTDVFGEPLNDAEWELQKSVAGALRRRAVSGEDFFQMVSIYDQSYYMMLYPEGMPVPLGMFGEIFDETLAALSVGEISEVVADEDGFYIICRLAEDADWFEDNKDYVWYYSAYEAFVKKIDEWSRELTITVSDAFWTLDLIELTAVG